MDGCPKFPGTGPPKKGLTSPSAVHGAGGVAGHSPANKTVKPAGLKSKAIFSARAIFRRSSPVERIFVNVDGLKILIRESRGRLRRPVLRSNTLIIYLLFNYIRQAFKAAGPKTTGLKGRWLFSPAFEAAMNFQTFYNHLYKMNPRL